MAAFRVNEKTEARAPPFCPQPAKTKPVLGTASMETEDPAASHTSASFGYATWFTQMVPGEAHGASGQAKKLSETAYSVARSALYHGTPGSAVMVSRLEGEATWP